MLLVLIRVAFCLVVATIAWEIGMGLLTSAGLLIGAIVLFNCGCRVAAKRSVSDYRRLRKAAARRILSSARAEPDAREVGR